MVSNGLQAYDGQDLHEQWEFTNSLFIMLASLVDVSERAANGVQLFDPDRQIAPGHLLADWDVAGPQLVMLAGPLNRLYNVPVVGLMLDRQELMREGPEGEEVPHHITMAEAATLRDAFRAMLEAQGQGERERQDGV
ncbi:hypothetical protein KIPB_010704 [Kipferlia bialata]|uniref:Uncharacterized protein n=1 Tax=Kipferlia bialata TaxID=797122 RepID=A0A9K3D441_9EUKA|nr:hypothetical protein KIPB_010704 [Kipferlia bialata]|eukprot:g10704.t1